MCIRDRLTIGQNSPDNVLFQYVGNLCSLVCKVSQQSTLHGVDPFLGQHSPLSSVPLCLVQADELWTFLLSQCWLLCIKKDNNTITMRCNRILLTRSITDNKISHHNKKLKQFILDQYEIKTSCFNTGETISLIEICLILHSLNFLPHNMGEHVLMPNAILWAEVSTFILRTQPFYNCTFNICLKV